MEFDICKAKQMNAASRTFEDTKDGSTNQGSAGRQAKPFQTLGTEAKRHSFRTTIDAINSPVIDEAYRQSGDKSLINGSMPLSMG